MTARSTVASGTDNARPISARVKPSAPPCSASRVSTRSAVVCRRASEDDVVTWDQVVCGTQQFGELCGLVEREVFRPPLRLMQGHQRAR